MIRDGLDRESQGDQCALILQDCWRKEIERAINEVKKAGKRTRLDKWFRRRFYIVLGSNRKRKNFGSRYGWNGRRRTDNRLVGPGGMQDGRRQR